MACKGERRDMATTTSIILDGDLSDWKGAPAFPAPYVTLNRNRWKGDLDLNATFYFAWDADNFYIGTVVTDDTHVQLPTTRAYDLYKGDDLEIWFDTNLPGDFTTSAGNSDDFQLGLSPGDFKELGPEAVFWNPNRSSARGSRCHSFSTLTCRSR